MKQLYQDLAIDTSSSASESFLAAAIELDEGMLFVADSPYTLGSDILLGIAKKVNTSSISLIENRLPSQFAFSFWINRVVTVYECVSTSGSIYAGSIVFEGIIAKEPSFSDGDLSLTFGTKARKIAVVPNYGLVETTEYPKAPEASQGLRKPHIVGTVEDCPLIPVSLPETSTLSADVVKGNVSLPLSDASKFTDVGAVWIDGETLEYSSKSETELFGLTIGKSHKLGTVVAQVGKWTYLAAGHAIGDVALVRSGDSILTPDDLDLAEATVSFNSPPIVRRISETYNQEIHFDQVESTGNMEYTTSYEIVDQNANGYITLGNLDTNILPPTNVSGAAYTFTITWDAQGNLAIDNPAAYTGYLGGQAFTLTKTAGWTTVNLFISDDAPINLTHFVNGGNGDIVPLITSVAVSWVTPSVSQPALQPLNAIKGVTAIINQNASSLPGATTVDSKNFATFARPNQDNIILGAYSINFSVDLTGYTGVSRVFIARQLVYMAQNQVVIFTTSAFTYDENTDQIAVQVEGGGNLTVSSLQRVVATGNLDDANYATLRYPSHVNFQSIQTTENKDLGDITKAQLVVEWFSTDAMAGTVNVKLGGRALGSLAQQEIPGDFFNTAVSIDTVSQGNANLSTSNINVNTLVSGGTSNIFDSPSFIKHTYTMHYQFDGPGDVSYRGRTNITPPPTAKTGASNLHDVTIKVSAGTTASGSNRTLVIYDSSSRTKTLTSGATITTAIYITSSSQEVRFVHDMVFATDMDRLAQVASIQVDWIIDPVDVNSVSASGSSTTTVPDSTLPNSGIDISLSGGNVDVIIPAAARTSINTFPLSWIHNWSDLTNQVVDINWSGGSTAANVGLVRTYISVEFNQATSELPTELTGTITGASGNPADVIQFLADSLGEGLNIQAKNKISAWAVANSFYLARRLSEPTEALTLLSYLAEQTNLYLTKRDKEIYPVRWLDVSEIPTPVIEEELLKPSRVSYISAIENDITFFYKENYKDASFGKVIRSYSGNNTTCSKSVTDIKDVRVSERNGGWVRSDVTAALVQDTYIKLTANLRKQATLNLPYSFTFLEEGDTILFIELTWRIVKLSRADSINLTMVEIPD